MFKNPKVTSQAPIHPPTCSSTSKASLLLLSIRASIVAVEAGKVGQRTWWGPGLPHRGPPRPRSGVWRVARSAHI